MNAMPTTAAKYYDHAASALTELETALCVSDLTVEDATNTLNEFFATCDFPLYVQYINTDDDTGVVNGARIYGSLQAVIVDYNTAGLGYDEEFEFGVDCGYCITHLDNKGDIIVRDEDCE